MDEFEGTLNTADGVFHITIRRPADAEPTKRKRTALPKTTRIRLLNVQEHICAICRGPMGLYDSHIDHIIPINAGGSDDITNLQLVHMVCNLRKGPITGPRDPDQERMPWA